MTRIPGIGRLIVEPIEEQERTTDSGLVIPVADQEISNYQMAIIKAVGEVKGVYAMKSIACIVRGAGIDIGAGELVILEGDILYHSD